MCSEGDSGSFVRHRRRRQCAAKSTDMMMPKNQLMDQRPSKSPFALLFLSCAAIIFNSTPTLAFSGSQVIRSRLTSISSSSSNLFDISYSANNSGGGGSSEASSSSSVPLPKGFTFDEDYDYDDAEIDGTLIADTNNSYDFGTVVESGCFAPEVNKWTTLMTDGTNAALHRPGKEMTLEEGIEILYNDLKDLSSLDYDNIERYWDQLLPTVSYLGTSNAEKVKQALRVAYRAHRSQMRKSGEPFIIHPVEVALLLSGMQMDAETVMAGLLHDTVEDTDLTFEQVEGMFGLEVRNIVEGETKVSKLPKLAFADYADEQAENLRQMFIAMTDDYRIIIVKLADRLHNMRTLRFMKPEKQKKISRETLDIFAPLAHRMGIWQVKSELEDTSFMYLYPDEYKKVNSILNRRRNKIVDTLDHSVKVLKETLRNDPTLCSQDVEIEVVGRTKEIYSLWHKMEMKHDRNLDHIADLVALRVILTPGDSIVKATQSADSGVWLCYHVLGLVQHLPNFTPMPTKVKDYISFPKPNGYQSLHTALMYKGQSVEVQIRTAHMHTVAEYGMASHWAYHDEKKRNTSMDLYNTPWLSSIKEWQQEAVGSRDFVDCVRRELLGKRVFVFLRNGKILNLARGTTAVDAAFQIHTEVGLNMHGVEINGKPVPLNYELQNGDVVSILTGEGKPSTEWMQYAKSRSTRSKLRAYFRSQQNDNVLKSGEMLFFDYLSNHRNEILEASFIEHPFEVPTNADELQAFLPGSSRYDDVTELLNDIGHSQSGDFLRQKVSKIFLVPASALQECDESRFANITRTVYASQLDSMSFNGANEEEDSDSESSEPVSYADMLNGGQAEFADSDNVCYHCLPVRGDAILGTRHRDGSSLVHRKECSWAQEALNKARFPSNDDSVGEAVELSWPEDEWEDNTSESFLTEVIIMSVDRKLLLADCSVIASQNSEILKTGSSSSNEHCILEFLVRVKDLDELQNLMDKLREVNSVMSVERRFGSELLDEKDL
ncbi:GTP diphosphokinase [Skeletonema marinoi]|uniref:Putative GTP diphosphokinase RSH1, chloroplastic n=1 Tax=Skeletonema marinoi TaxID=267567 RepID=A0AAD9DCI0_9STRA|nr:GTP diphosphokinase [Skeletonema marinoi]